MLRALRRSATARIGRVEGDRRLVVSLGNGLGADGPVLVDLSLASPVEKTVARGDTTFDLD